MEYVVQLSLCIFSLRILREIRVLFPFFPVTWSSSKQYSQEPSEAKTKRQKPGEAKAKSQVKPKSQKPDYVFSWLIEEIRGHRKPKARSQVKPKRKANSQSEAKAKSHGPKKLNAKKPKANNQKPITKSQEPKWSQKLKAKRKPEQSQKPKAKKPKAKKPKAKKPSGHLKPKAKWARKWEILAPKCMQNTDFSSKEQQIAGKAAPDWKKKSLKKTKKILKKYTLLSLLFTLGLPFPLTLPEKLTWLQRSALHAVWLQLHSGHRGRGGR